MNGHSCHLLLNFWTTLPYQFYCRWKSRNCRRFKTVIPFHLTTFPLRHLSEKTIIIFPSNHHHHPTWFDFGVRGVPILFRKQICVIRSRCDASPFNVWAAWFTEADHCGVEGHFVIHSARAVPERVAQALAYQLEREDAFTVARNAPKRCRLPEHFIYGRFW